jgi:hypothetical protein
MEYNIKMHMHITTSKWAGQSQMGDFIFDVAKSATNPLSFEYSLQITGPRYLAVSFVTATE